VGTVVTQGIYEIGVQFDEEIDASPFKDAEPPGAAVSDQQSAVSSQRSAGGRQPGR
jgi:hypothetical protein